MLQIKLIMLMPKAQFGEASPVPCDRFVIVEMSANSLSLFLLVASYNIRVSFFLSLLFTSYFYRDGVDISRSFVQFYANLIIQVHRELSIP